MVTATTAKTALPRGVPCPVPGGWNRGQAVCRDCVGQWGEVPGGWTRDDGAASLSRLSVWSYVVGEGCAACFLSALDVFPLRISLSLLSRSEAVNP